MNRIAAFMTHGVPSEYDTLKERAFVTFTCLPEGQSPYNAYGELEEDNTITLLERRNLISGSRTTGHRTWEAALHLGSYLLTKAGQGLIRGKSILELGGGTGFLAILCTKHLGARHVTTTDGDECVVDALKENITLNYMDDDAVLDRWKANLAPNDRDRTLVTARTLWWGEELEGTWVEQACHSNRYDMVIGADIVSYCTSLGVPPW
jgi:predicted nicotinamide N-methyase